MTRRNTWSASARSGKASLPTGTMASTAARIIALYASIARFRESCALRPFFAVNTRITMCGITGIAVAQIRKYPIELSMFEPAR